MKLGQKVLRLVPSIVRHLVIRNSTLYDQILQHLRAQGDIWIVSQGEYINWWIKRENASLKITVSEGRCHVHTTLENAVIQRFPEEFLDSPIVLCEGTEFSGEVWITLDSALQKKELLIEILKREGILNFRVAKEGEFLLSQENVGPILEEIDGKLYQRQYKAFEDGVCAIRQIVVDELDAHKLPLLRIWYHPRVDGTVAQAVFSPRFDVDRAIANVRCIQSLERKHNVSSTLYLRVLCPFYTDEDVKKLVSVSGCSEIALHGEFIAHTHKYGDEFQAAQAEKDYLEKLTGRPILGISMHGGELSFNQSANTDNAIHQAGFLYDTTPWMRYYFPFKKIVEGQFVQSYSLPHSFGEVTLIPFKPIKRVVDGRVQKSYRLAHILGIINSPSVRRYNQTAFDKTIAKMNQIYEQNGVFVIMLHPVYFGFFSYLLRPKNWISLAKSMANYFKQSLS